MKCPSENLAMQRKYFRWELSRNSEIIESSEILENNNMDIKEITKEKSFYIFI